ncbi:MAG: purine-nucleoside phosphorylase [Clostridia bacterium]|nr:purine-nucleoside phosphorylase [Clostridia bacterium]
MIQTPHINQTADVAQTVLLPGDPKRAKFIAENFLTDALQFNDVRGAAGFTGMYKGKSISVMGTGMGMPSMGIYAYELIHFFGCKNLIRIGSCGALQENLKLYDIIVAMGASTNSNFAHQFNLPGVIAPLASWELLSKVHNAAQTLKTDIHVGNILSSDTFYAEDTKTMGKWRDMGILGVEMEAAALYLTAARAGANAICILTVSDHIFTKQEITAQEREKSFSKMIELALETATFEA